MNNVKRKGVLLVISLLLLIAAGLYMAFGWYTKMTSIGSMQFDVARWDFSANYSLGDLQLNVYKYAQVNDGAGDKAAPGTAGEIPVLLSAEASETDIDYSIVIDKTTMGAEFQERIFFYKDADMTQVITPDTTLTGIIKKGSTVTVKVYWKWIYEFGDIPKMAGDNTQTVDGYPLVSNETEKTFDEFDTAVGKRPDLYEPQMTATLKISGLQSEPQAATT